MIPALLKRVFTRQGVMLLLTLTALCCLPLALSGTVRDAAISLLLPVTLLSTLIAWGLGLVRANKVLVSVIMILAGPLILFVRVGQLGGTLFEMGKQLLGLFAGLIVWLIDEIPPDVTALISVSGNLADKALALWDRLYLWLVGIYYGIRVEDPAARALVWSVGLWLSAAWAGWQISRHMRPLAGLLPTTVVLALIADYTGAQKAAFWIHLAALLFLLGLTRYEALFQHWETIHTDYSESTAQDTLIASSALALILASAAMMISSFSLKDLVNRLREPPPASAANPRVESLGLEAQKVGRAVSGMGAAGLPRAHLLGSGPELSQQVVMTIETGDFPPMPHQANLNPPHYYWRTLTYETYTGAGWRNPDVLGVNVTPNEILLRTPPINYRPVHQQVIFSNNPDGRLYWTGMLRNADVPLQIAWHAQAADQLTETGGDPFLGADMLGALTAVSSYRAESLLLQVGADDLREASPYYPDWVARRYLRLPGSIPERVLALARDLTASEPTPYDRAIAIENYLRQIPYTLDIPAPPRGRDAADYFLFDLKQGYCDYYATSMVVLARAAGLPARFVTGYASGSYDPERARYIVTAAHAHSWAEIYFSGIGWVEFEPTASQPAILRAGQGEEQAMAPVIVSRKSLLEDPAIFMVRLLRNGWLPVVIFFCFFLIWIGTDSLRLGFLEPAEAIQRLYRRLRRLARPMSGSLSIDQTAHEFAASLTKRLSALESQSRLRKWLSPSHSEINLLTDLYTRSLFSHAISTRDEFRCAIRTWSRLQWRILLANGMAIRKGEIAK